MGVVESTDNQTSAQARSQAAVNVKEQSRRIQALLADRTVLLKTAHNLNSSALYTPEYQEYLKTTMTKLTAMNASGHFPERLVQE